MLRICGGRYHKSSWRRQHAEGAPFRRGSEGEQEPHELVHVKLVYGYAWNMRFTSIFGVGLSFDDKVLLGEMLGLVA
jgi:hypothetical protein